MVSRNGSGVCSRCVLTPVPQKSSKLSKADHAHLTSLVRTVLFTELFYGFQPDVTVERALKLWTKELQRVTGGETNPLEVLACRFSCCHRLHLVASPLHHERTVVALRRGSVHHQEFVSDMLCRRHTRGESLTESLIIYCALTPVGVGPVLGDPNLRTFQWSLDTPEDVPFPFLQLRFLAADGYRVHRPLAVTVALLPSLCSSHTAPVHRIHP